MVPCVPPFRYPGGPAMFNTLWRSWWRDFPFEILWNVLVWGSGMRSWRVDIALLLVPKQVPAAAVTILLNLICSCSIAAAACMWFIYFLPPHCLGSLAGVILSARMEWPVSRADWSQGKLSEMPRQKRFHVFSRHLIHSSPSSPSSLSPPSSPSSPSSLSFCHLSFIRSFLHSFISSFIHSLTHSFLPSFISFFLSSFLHSFIHSFIQPVSQSASQSVSQPFTDSTIQWFSQSLSHSVICSFTPSFLNSFIPPVSQPASQAVSQSVIQPFIQPVGQSFIHACRATLRFSEISVLAYRLYSSPGDGPVGQC